MENCLLLSFKTHSFFAFPDISVTVGEHKHTRGICEKEKKSLLDVFWVIENCKKFMKTYQKY